MKAILFLGGLIVVSLLVFGTFEGSQEVIVYNCMDKTIPAKAELECRHIRDFKQPTMKEGCVFQESHGQVIKTCG